MVHLEKFWSEIVVDNEGYQYPTYLVEDSTTVPLQKDEAHAILTHLQQCWKIGQSAKRPLWDTKFYGESLEGGPEVAVDGCFLEELSWGEEGEGSSRASLLMLPSGRAHRLVSVLTQALDDCNEQQQQLQQKLGRYQTLLGDWNSHAPESPKLQESKHDDQEREPSAKEHEELELLNKALEKALRVRAKFHHAPCEAAEGIKMTEKPIASVALIHPEANSKKKVSKPSLSSSSSKKSVSSKKPSTYVPKAPYRTDPDVKRAPSKRSIRLSVQPSKVPGRRSPRRTATRTGQVPVIAHVASGEGCSVGSGTLARPSVSQQRTRPSSSFKSSAGGGDIADVRSSLVECGPSDSVAENPLAKREGAPGMYAAPQTSTLEEKGSQLKLPLPYRTIFSKYISLLEECRLCPSSREAVAAKSHFMEKLQATFCSPPPAYSPVEVQKHLRNLREVCSLLKQYMDAETPASLGENLTWEKEYESLLTVEGLEAIVSQYLEKVHQLKDAMDSHAKMFPDSACCVDGCTSKCADLGKEQRCWNAEILGPPPLLFYSSLKELKDMEALKLQVAILNQQLDIQEAMEAELLPLLEPGRMPEDSKVLLCRAVYSLLCEGGERFPVLVTDEE